MLQNSIRGAWPVRPHTWHVELLMSWDEEICVSCGLCCTTLSTVRIAADDIERLMQGYHLTREQALGMVQRDTTEFTILMEKTAACPAKSEEHTSELQSPDHLVCRLLLEKKKKSKKVRKESRR